MFTKKIVVTALIGLTMVVGCSKTGGDAPNGEQLGDSLGQSADGLVGALQQSAPAKPAAAPRGPVTCSGDQNGDGRICCDDTHCCINIGGKINCKLGPMPKTMK
ncbi:MAG TPA: hypothetical protein VIF62_18180 [Labilithrix sp.]